MVLTFDADDYQIRLRWRSWTCCFHYTNSSHRNTFSIAAQWLACTFPCRRFADILADACAPAQEPMSVRYSFIVVDLHHLLLAGLPGAPVLKTQMIGRACQRRNLTTSATLLCRLRLPRDDRHRKPIKLAGARRDTGTRAGLVGAGKDFHPGFCYSQVRL